MKLQEFLGPFIDKKFTILYSFAYTLVGNQKEAEKIFFDSFMAFLLENSNKIEVLFSPDNYYRREKDLFHLILMSTVAQQDLLLAKISPRPYEEKYFLLGLYERAIIFLRHKTNLELKEIAEIADFQINKVVSLLQSGRKFLSSEDFTSERFQYEVL